MEAHFHVVEPVRQNRIDEKESNQILHKKNHDSSCEWYLLLVLQGFILCRTRVSYVQSAIFFAVNITTQKPKFMLLDFAIHFQIQPCRFNLISHMHEIGLDLY